MRYVPGSLVTVLQFLKQHKLFANAHRKSCGSFDRVILVEIPAEALFEYSSAAV